MHQERSEMFPTDKAWFLNQGILCLVIAFFSFILLISFIFGFGEEKGYWREGHWECIEFYSAFCPNGAEEIERAENSVICESQSSKVCKQYNDFGECASWIISPDNEIPFIWTEFGDCKKAVWSREFWMD